MFQRRLLAYFIPHPVWFSEGVFLGNAKDIKLCVKAEGHFYGKSWR
jgi:hypothetical protein